MLKHTELREMLCAGSPRYREYLEVLLQAHKVDLDQAYFRDELRRDVAVLREELPKYDLFLNLQQKDEGDLFRRPVDMRVTFFSSGNTSSTDIDAFRLARLNVGVGGAVVSGELGTNARSCQKSCVDAISRAVRDGLKVFVDSGAFQEFKEQKTITHQEWKNILNFYVKVSAKSPKQFFVVAPDKIGDQQETLRRIKRYKDVLTQQLSKVNLLIPLQRGILRLSDLFLQIYSILGGRPLIAAFPSNEAPIPVEEVFLTLQEIQKAGVRPAGVHFLGISPRRKRSRSLVVAVRSIFPDMPVYMDSSIVGAITPSGAVQNQWKKGIDQSVSARLFDDTQDMISSEDSLSYTDYISLPSVWMSQSEILEFAQYLPEEERQSWIQDPDDWLQNDSWNGETQNIEIVDSLLDQAWTESYKKRLGLGSLIRRESIVQTFKD
jgi:hypothetical protein